MFSLVPIVSDPRRPVVNSVSAPGSRTCQLLPAGWALVSDAAFAGWVFFVNHVHRIILRSPLPQDTATKFISEQLWKHL